MLAPVARADALADWTRLPVAKFGECYELVRSPGALNWNVIVVLDAADPVRSACREAEDEGFLSRLAKAVANAESLANREATQIGEMLASVSQHGVMQAITDQQRGFMNARILYPLVRASEACAIVHRTDPLPQQLGTAFLVRPDLVLTAAHVVTPIGRPELIDGLQFEFTARPGRDEGFKVRPAAENALVAYSPPHGTAMNALDVTLDLQARERLDFALIRLAQRVDHVIPVEIADDATVSQGKPCWAFGYPPGNTLLFDVDLVTQVSEDAGRWLHRANAIGGMSGGCCVNHEGEVSGIHEGAVQDNGRHPPVTLNRGVSIAAIRRAQCRNGRDPLKQLTVAPGLEFQDPLLVAALYRAGLRLGGPALAEPWRAQFLAALRDVAKGSGAVPDPETSTGLPPFHPWFARPDVEGWIDSKDSNARVCLVHGEAGVGKSFCARIVREMLTGRDVDLVEFGPTHVGAMSWSDAISQVLATQEPAYRTVSAAVRYRDVHEVLAELTRRASGRRQGSCVVIDFGEPGKEDRFVGSPWLELVATLAAMESMRIMLIGLEEFERAALIDRMLGRPETEDVKIDEPEISPMKREELLAYARRLAIARGRTLKERELRDSVASLVPENLVVPAHMRTCAFALAAIVFEARVS